MSDAPADRARPIGMSVTGLHKAFGSQAVLTGVDLDVPAGSFVAILGASGSGKTTLLRILAGFEHADRGTVTVGDVLVDGGGAYVPAERRRLGYVSQEGSLFPHLSVEANIGFGLARHRRRGTEVGQLLDAVGLSGLGRRYPHQLSGGQQQRVALARTLAVRPQAVLLDEPFASLDSHLRASVRNDVRAILSAAGTTALLVTHDQDEALSVADHVAIIRNGTIGQFGTPQDLYDHPVDPGVAQFLGNANLVDVTVDGDQVTTPFGPMSLRTSDRLPVGPTQGRAVGLVRPEQLAVSATIDGAGMRGVVVGTQFHGHDTVITVEPAPAGTGSGARTGGPVVVRADGDLVIADGTAVEVTGGGSVIVWPRADPDATGPAGSRSAAQEPAVS